MLTAKGTSSTPVHQTAKTEKVGVTRDGKQNAESLRNGNLWERSKRRKGSRPRGETLKSLDVRSGVSHTK